MMQTVFSSFEPTELKALFREAVREELEPVILQLQQPQPTKETKDYYTRHEVCQLLNISLGTLHTKTKEGGIVSHRIGRRVLYKVSDVEAALHKRTFRPQEGATSWKK